MSSKRRSSCKFKLALGSDIRRLKTSINNIEELKQTTLKVFGRELATDEQKYFYYDSDDDRIDVSDDEDLESAIQQWKKTWLKLYVENYDSKKDPFFRSNDSSHKAEVKTGASTERSKIEENKISKLVPSTKSVDSSIESFNDENEEVPISFASIKETESCDSSMSEEEKEEVVGETMNNSIDNHKINQRKNTEIDQHAFDMLDEKECKVSSRSIPRG